MLRITGGQWRGRRLKTPPGAATRPTSDKVKEALFSILGGQVLGARVADLFAGSGALGLEALSRGAVFCLFVETNGLALKALRENLSLLGTGGQAQVMAVDASQARVWQGHSPFDLLLADPPYDMGLVARVTSAVSLAGVMGDGGRLVIEHSPRERPSPMSGLELYDHRVYGQTELSFLLKQS